MSAGQPSSLDLDAIDLNPKALEGLTVVITGTLPNLSRKQAQELVERSGGQVTGSISSKTNLLIAGVKAGSKLKKAEELGVEVLDENGFLEYISIQTNQPTATSTLKPEASLEGDAVKYTNSAKVKYNDGDLEGALIDLNKALDIDQNHIDAYYNRGAALYANGDLISACSDWGYAAELGDSDSAELLRKLHLSITAKDLFEKIGESVKSNILNKYPGGLPRYNDEYSIDFFMDDVKKAIKLLKFDVSENILRQTVKMVADSTKTLLNESWDYCGSYLWRDSDESKATMNERGQKWQLTHDDLINAGIEFEEQGEAKLARLCGYYNESDEKIEILVDKYREAVTEYQHCLPSDRTFYAIENRIATTDEEHCGYIYIPRRCIISDPQRYNIDNWEEVNFECLSQECMSDEEAIDELESYEEPMMRIFQFALVYIDNGNWVSMESEEDELEALGFNPDDVHPNSEWHHG